jgi:hypothetical protein
LTRRSTNHPSVIYFAGAGNDRVPITKRHASLIVSHCFVGQMFKSVSKFIAPSGAPSPVLWGDETTVRERLGPGLSDLSMIRRYYTLSYPFPSSEVVEFFRLYYGPMNQAFASVHPVDRERLRQELEALWSSHNRAGAGSTTVLAEYLEVIGVRA